MGILENLNTEPISVSSVGTRTVTFTFAALPESLEQLQALPESDLRTPFRTAALTVCALCACVADRSAGIEMLSWLKGSGGLTGQDIGLLDSCLRGGRDRIPFSYFAGAVPENNYTPSCPFMISVSSDHNSGAEQGYMKLYITSSCMGGQYPVKLRMNSDGKWLLWEQYLFPGVTEPKSAKI